MATGGSKPAALKLAWQEVGGEHRHAASGVAFEGGGGAGTADPGQAAPLVDRRPCSPVRRPVHLVCDPAFLLVAWNRVRTNKGARTAGVDGMTARSIAQAGGEDKLLADLRADLKARSFRPLSVREHRILKADGKSFRRLGIPVVRDRVVQASLKLVLEPILEADFSPASYGFRPNRRAQDRHR